MQSTVVVNDALSSPPSSSTYTHTDRQTHSTQYTDRHTTVNFAVPISCLSLSLSQKKEAH